MSKSTSSDLANDPPRENLNDTEGDTVPTTIRRNHQGAADADHQSDPLPSAVSSTSQHVPNSSHSHDGFRSPQSPERLPDDINHHHTFEIHRQTAARRTLHSRPASARDDITQFKISLPLSSRASFLSDSHLLLPSSQTSEQPPFDENSRTLEICQETAHGPLPVHYMSVKPFPAIDGTIINEMIEEDRKANRNITRITAKEPVAIEALKFMLQMIMKGIVQQVQTKLSFDRFVDVAVACWHYRCPMDSIEYRADELHDDLWKHNFPNRRGGQLRSWMFLALIFGWPDVFASASRVLTSECKASDGGEEFLPEELELAIQTKRAEVLWATYDFVHEKYLEQVDQYRRDRRNPLFDAIPRDFENELGTAITPKSQLLDLAKITSSSRLLDIFESTIEAALEPFKGVQSDEASAYTARRPVSPGPSEQTRRPVTGNSRRSPLAYQGTRAGIFNDPKLLEDAKNGLKKMVRKGTRTISNTFRRSKNQSEAPQNNIPPGDDTGTAGLQDVCKRLQLESAGFRAQNFIGLDIRDYLPLKAKHLPP